MTQLNQNRGTFITLSQYVNDLTINRSEGNNYKVIPSRFVALNVNFSKGVSETLLATGSATRSSTEPTTEPTTESTPGSATGSATSTVSPNNENIITYINNFERLQANQRLQNNNYNSATFATNFVASFFGNGKIFLNSEKVYNNGNVNIISTSEVDGVAYSDIYCYISDQVQSTSSSFNINTIIVYYNVKNSDGTYIYENIPLGIYFTGSISNGSMTNSITKYNTNATGDRIGTSYGIRISSKFITTTDTALQVNDDSQYYAEMSHVLSKMDHTYQKLNDLISNIHGQTQSYKDLYAIFKNSRTNVPYIKEVNGAKYWFVNGRQLELVTNDNIGTESVLGLQISFIEPQATLFEYIDGQSYEINFKWDILYNRTQIVPDQLKFKHNTNEPLKLIPNMNSLIYKVEPDDAGSHNFVIDVTYNGNNASVGRTINFVHPSYYGIIPCEHSDSENQWTGVTNSPITEDNINTLTKVLSVDKSNNLVFNIKNGWGYIVYMYPESYGILSNIKYNELEYLTDYKRFTPTIINGIQYYVYVSKVGIYEGSYQIKFE